MEKHSLWNSSFIAIPPAFPFKITRKNCNFKNCFPSYDGTFIAYFMPQILLITTFQRCRKTSFYTPLGIFSSLGGFFLR